MIELFVLTVSLVAVPILVYEWYMLEKKKKGIIHCKKIQCEVLNVIRMPVKEGKYYVTVIVDGIIVVVFTHNRFVEDYKNGEKKEIVNIKGKFFFCEESFGYEKRTILFCFFIVIMIILILSSR